MENMNYYLCKPTQEHSQLISQYRQELLDVDSSFDGTGGLERFSDPIKWIYDTRLYESYDTCPPNMSLGFQYLFIDNDSNQIVGMVNIRPDGLNHPNLKLYGGNIGYSILPSRRREGLGTLMLKEALKICKDVFGLDKVLVTCLKNNEGSRKVILANNGEYEKDIYCPYENSLLERYWIYL